MLFTQERTDDNKGSRYTLVLEDSEIVEANFYDPKWILPRKENSISDQLESLTIIARAIEVKKDARDDAEGGSDSSL